MLSVHRGGVASAYWLYTMRIAAALRSSFITAMKARLPGRLYLILSTLNSITAMKARLKYKV